MSARVEQLIGELDLSPHPEGGYYRETYRSKVRVTKKGGGDRSAITSIYFLLVAGAPSRWHRHGSDELWHWFEGAPLRLLDVDPVTWRLRDRRLGPLASGDDPQLEVPAERWQAAGTTGEYSLVGCTVGPGFEFEEFAMLRDDSGAREEMTRHHPAVAEWI